MGSHATKTGALPEPQPGLNAPRVPVVPPAKATGRDTGSGAASLRDRPGEETGSVCRAAKWFFMGRARLATAQGLR